MRYGLLVPHFGEYASRGHILDMTVEAVEAGIESVWVRDHLIWTPHGMEGSNATFLDPFVTLGAISAIAPGVTLGTGVVIPIRRPLKLAQEFTSLSFLNGGSVIAGIGMGFSRIEYASAGYEYDQREAVLAETIAICRQAWEFGHVTYRGEVFAVDNVDVAPTPPEPIPIVYGGSTPKAVRRAVDMADGWYPGRLPLRTLEKRLQYLRDYAGARAQDMSVTVQPLVCIANSREEAAGHIPLNEMGASSAGAAFWDLPPSGRFESVDDLDGLVVFGTPEDVVSQIKVIGALGVDDFIFDLRLQFHEYERALRRIIHEVVPALK